MKSKAPIILAHGGAGLHAMTVPQAACLQAALQVGYHLLDRGGPALIAVEHTIRVLEQSGLFNAGKGGRLQLDGIRRMDASIMEGHGLGAGAVASIEHIVHPITAARLVMEKTDHVLLVGQWQRNLPSISGWSASGLLLRGAGCRMARCLSGNSRPGIGMARSAPSHWIALAPWQPAHQPAGLRSCSPDESATRR